jgi:D-alanyl-D-alanine carboxypeptidase
MMHWLLSFVMLTTFFFCVALFGLQVGATAPATMPAPTRTHYVLPATTTVPLVEVSAYIVVDALDGTVLLEHEADTTLPIASLTKLLVAGAITESLPLDATTTITEDDVATAEAYGKLEAGQVYSGRELLFPYLLESSNDAGVALARLYSTTWSSALEDMLDQAGVASAVAIPEPTGLLATNVATARALATASAYLWTATPEVFDITNLSVYRGPYVSLVNNSPVQNIPGYVGGKHGFTNEAGRTQVAFVTTSVSGEERLLLYVLLGATDTKNALITLGNTISTTITRTTSQTATSAIITTSVDR